MFGVLIEGSTVRECAYQPPVSSAPFGYTAVDLLQRVPLKWSWLWVVGYRGLLPNRKIERAKKKQKNPNHRSFTCFNNMEAFHGLMGNWNRNEHFHSDREMVEVKTGHEGFGDLWREKLWNTENKEKKLISERKVNKESAGNTWREEWADRTGLYLSRW